MIVSPPNWRGSLGRLLTHGCPSLDAPVDDRMPRNAVIVLDHHAITDVVATTIEALTGAGFENELIVPELALDFFDKDAKETSAAAFGGSAGAASLSQPASPTTSLLRPRELVDYTILRQKKDVLLNRGKYRVKVQRADQYNMEMINTLKIDAKGYDTRLYVLCALFFREKTRRPTIIVSTDPVVKQLAAEHNIPTCAAADIVKCRSLLDASPAPHQAPSRQRCR